MDGRQRQSRCFIRASARKPDDFREQASALLSRQTPEQGKHGEQDKTLRLPPRQARRREERMARASRARDKLGGGPPLWVGGLDF